MLNLLFPRVCSTCKSTLSKNETVLCVSCRHDLPIVCHHRTGSTAMKDIFYGRFAIEHATALLQFQKKGITQELIHNLKYRGQKEISSFFGSWLGSELSENSNYSQCELVIPVPLHKQKLKKRGYNQVTGFGTELAKALRIEYREDILVKISKTNSQVFKKRFTRFNSEEIFTVQNEDYIQNKHILLVDDIVTTGATMENCALQLLKNSNAKLSLAAIAIA